MYMYLQAASNASGGSLVEGRAKNNSFLKKSGRRFLFICIIYGAQT